MALRRRHLPSLILALGTVAATGIAVVTRESRLVLAGPAFLAGTIVAVRVFERRMDPGSGASLRVALLLAVIFLVAGVIMSLRNPGQLPFTVAILGGGAVVALGDRGKRGHRR